MTDAAPESKPVPWSKLAVVGALVAAIVVAIQWKTAMFSHTSFAVLFVLYTLYGLSIIGLGAVITVFFDQPISQRRASVWALFFE